MTNKDPKRAAAWMGGLRDWLREAYKGQEPPRDDSGMNIFEAIDLAVYALTPPENGWRYRWALTPNENQMPFEDLERVQSIWDEIDEDLKACIPSDDAYDPGKSECDLTLASPAELKTMQTALEIYQDILEDVHRDRILEEERKQKETEAAIDAKLEWHPATELPEVGHWYKVRGADTIACGYAVLAKTEWGSIDWIMNGLYHLATKDNIVTEWRYLTDEEKGGNDAR